jgi:UDP-glucose 4-epimerase
MSIRSDLGRVCITGCAGFIGSTLVDRLLAEGTVVVGIDNFSTGQERFLESALRNPRFTLIRGDLLDVEKLQGGMAGCDTVFHFAANADVRFGTAHPRKDLEQNTIATFNVLEAMRIGGIRRLIFSSTGSVYGEARVIPTPENAPFPVQTSLYGASKLAAEGLIAAYAEGFGIQAYIFRLVSILGERYTHGHIFDFYRNLKDNPAYLRVLGNGMQRKSYLYIEDCLNAIFVALQHDNERVAIFNLGVDGHCQVNDSIGWICEILGLRPQLEYTGGERGWVGDNPLIHLDTSKIRALGWQPRLSIRQGVEKTLAWLRQNEWVLERRL